MSSRLEILALEPFYGGSRRAMLDAVMRCSRHQWTLLKLPARRMERRLEAAAQWFAEQMSRHDFGRADVVFTSEAMNLSELQRLVPRLARRPAVVYFHDNQLPSPAEVQADWFESRRGALTAATDGGDDWSAELSGWPTEPEEPTGTDSSTIGGSLDEDFSTDRREITDNPLSREHFKARTNPAAKRGLLATVNLNTAMAAAELWFNGEYTRQLFIDRASALIDMHPDLRPLNPMPMLRRRMAIVPPPVDLSLLQELASEPTQRDPRTIFVDTRNANLRLLVTSLKVLRQTGERFTLITTGPQQGIPDELDRIVIPERDEFGRARGIRQAGVYVSAKVGANHDEHIVPALTAGCWPVVPDSGFYGDLLPLNLHINCMHDGSPDSLVSRILDAWYVDRPEDYEHELVSLLGSVDFKRACDRIDDRLAAIAGGGAYRG